MFGLKIVTKKKLREMEHIAKNQALCDLIALLKKSDKIFLEPVVLNGDNQEISNCVFLDCGVTVNSKEDSSILRNLIR